MRDLGLDALVRDSRTVNAPSEEAREHHRRLLARRIAAGVVGAAAAGGAREAAAAMAGAAAPGTGAPAALSGVVAKWAVVSVLVAVGGATGVGVYVGRGVSPIPAVAVAPSDHAVARAAVGEQPVAPVPVTVAEVRPPAQPAAMETGSAARRAHAFDRELELLRSARRALDTGSPARALALLDQYAAEFPRGTLKAECQTTRILALCAAGRVTSAQQARDEFIKQQPGSPLADGLRATCAGGH